MILQSLPRHFSYIVVRHKTNLVLSGNWSTRLSRPMGLWFFDVLFMNYKKYDCTMLMKIVKLVSYVIVCACNDPPSSNHKNEWMNLNQVTPPVG